MSAQSAIVLVGVLRAPEGGGTAGDDDAAKAERVMAAAEAEGWLGRPTDVARWRSYFDELLSSERARMSAAADGAWLALSLKGRSCGSGLGTPPWDELLGTQLTPIQPLSPAEPAAPSTDAESAVLDAQRHLYAALTSADAAGVVALCMRVDDDEVSSLREGGRLDGWETVLKYDATVGMSVSSQDARVAPSGDEAWSTALEFPANGGGASLLCTQRWVNINGAEEGAAPDWRLAQHRTIPYADGVDAAACLRCDWRGCVALQRTAGLRGAAGMPGDGKA